MGNATGKRERKAPSMKARRREGTGSPTLPTACVFANRNARCVPVQVFSVGKRNDRSGVARQPLRVVALDAAALEEVVDADAAGEARSRVRRQAVARPGDVI